MAKKSNYGRKRISATEASRSFSRLLDLVERGRQFLIHRHGRDVCVMTAPPLEGRAASACLDLLRGRTPVTLDDRFSADLLDIVATEPVEDRPEWDS